MPPAAPTIRALARQLGLSRTTVSEALRGLPRIQQDTAKRVCDAAEKAGYRPNPMASAVMSQIRRSRAQAFRGGLAAVNIDEAGRPLHAQRYHDALIDGARERAVESGSLTAVPNVEVLGLDGPQFAHQSVVLGIGNLGCIELVVLLVVEGDQLTEPGRPLCGIATAG